MRWLCFEKTQKRVIYWILFRCVLLANDFVGIGSQTLYLVPFIVSGTSEYSASFHAVYICWIVNLPVRVELKIFNLYIYINNLEM